MKVAAALVIIRNRPVGISGKQYSQQLCDHYQKTQFHLQSRIKNLEQRLLKTQQQLIVTSHFTHQDQLDIEGILVYSF